MENDDLILELERVKSRISELESEVCRNNAATGGRSRIHKRILIPVTVLCFVILGTFAIGATVPNSFTAGDPISASQMNENFSYIISRLWEVTGANLHYSAGNVGIGTSNPTEKLEVIGTVDADAFTVNGTVLGSSTSTYWNESGGDLSYTLGDIGIGTATPTAIVDIAAQGGTQELIFSGAGVNANVYANTAAEFLLGTMDAQDFSLVTGGAATRRMTITSTGDIGIGTTTPIAKVDVMDGQIRVTDSASAGAYVAIGNEDDWTGAEGDWGNYIVGNQGVSRGLRIGVNNDGFFRAEIELENNNAATGNIFFKTTNVNANATTRMTIESDGQVGIGTTTPAYQLELSTDSAGKPTSNTWTIVSDKRLKENIRPFDDGLETIMQIRPVSYELNGKGNQPKGAKGISVVAQEAATVIPYAISTFKGRLEPGDKTETDLYAFNSSSLTFILINAVKELKTENDRLKERIARLETISREK